MLDYEKRLAWFNQARFGMFIHWGLYSLLGRGEWTMFAERIPPDEYTKLAAQFNPAKFDAYSWASLAKEPPDRNDTVIKLKLDGKPKIIDYSGIPL